MAEGTTTVSLVCHIGVQESRVSLGEQRVLVTTKPREQNYRSTFSDRTRAIVDEGPCSRRRAVEERYP